MTDQPDDPYATPPAGDQPSGQPPPPPPPYGQPQYGYGQPYGYGPKPGTNGMAIASLICAFFCSPLGIIFGVIARGQIKRTGQGGDGLAIAGIIISAVFIAIGIIVAIVSESTTSTTTGFGAAHHLLMAGAYR